MPKVFSHVPEKSIRKYPGEERTSRFIEWLNFEKDQEARRRIVELADLLGELKMVAYSLPKSAARSGSAWASNSKVKRLNALEKAINERLRRYKCVREVFAGMGGFLQVLWNEVDYVAPTDDSWQQRRPVLSEFGALNGLLNSIEWGDFWKIKICECGTFFFARFKHQVSCSEKCRTKKYRSSAEWVRYRNDKARQYYWLHKNKNVK